MKYQSSPLPFCNIVQMGYTNEELNVHYPFDSDKSIKICVRLELSGSLSPKSSTK